MWILVACTVADGVDTDAVVCNRVEQAFGAYMGCYDAALVVFQVRGHTTSPDRVMGSARLPGTQTYHQLAL